MKFLILFELCHISLNHAGAPLFGYNLWKNRAHELFIEADPQRHAALNATLAFFARY
jgi:lysophospholipase